MREGHLPLRDSACPRHEVNCLERQSHAELISRKSPSIMSLPPTSPPSADDIYPREVDKLDRPAVENGVRHVDGFDQIFGSSSAHHLFSPIARTSARRGSPQDGDPQRPSRRNEGQYASPGRQECFQSPTSLGPRGSSARSLANDVSNGTLTHSGSARARALPRPALP